MPINGSIMVLHTIAPMDAECLGIGYVHGMVTTHTLDGDVTFVWKESVGNFLNRASNFSSDMMMVLIVHTKLNST